MLDRSGGVGYLVVTMNAATRSSKVRYFCPVCEREDHNARIMPSGVEECPVRVIRFKAEAGCGMPGTNPGTTGPAYFR